MFSHVQAQVARHSLTAWDFTGPNMISLVVEDESYLVRLAGVDALARHSE